MYLLKESQQLITLPTADDSLLKEVDLLKRSIHSQLVTYIEAKFECKIEHYSLKVRSKSNYEMGKKCIETKHMALRKELDQIFNEFCILSRDCIEYGMKGNPNYYVCRRGVTDAYKNAIWIHENRLREFISENVPKNYPVYGDFELYRELLHQLK